jgi:DNA adenine methylase
MAFWAVAIVPPGGSPYKEAGQMGAVVEWAAPRVTVRPPLKWAGGKRWLVPEVKKLWMGHEDQRFVEPLCGGLAVTLGLLPQRALVNDINPHTIHFYRWLKKGLQISKDLPMEHEESAYYRNRDRFNALVPAGQAHSKEAAGLFYYLNRTCYNGLCRFNRKGEFNVPFGKYRRIEYRRDFRSYSEVFSNWEFMCDDFENVPLEATDFIYADPPYDVEFTQYAKEDFGWRDQERLAKWLAKHEGPVIISNQATGRVQRLYRDHGFELFKFNAPRLISCTGDRTPAQEVLAIKNL